MYRIVITEAQTHGPGPNISKFRVECLTTRLSHLGTTPVRENVHQNIGIIFDKKTFFYFFHRGERSEQIIFNLTVYIPPKSSSSSKNPIFSGGEFRDSRVMWSLPNVLGQTRSEPRVHRNPIQVCYQVHDLSGFSGQSYKHFTLVNYESWVVITSKLFILTTLEL